METSNVKYYQFYLLFLLGLLSCESNVTSNQKERLPNIIVIMTDDSGYSDTTPFGGEISTPNIDFLSEKGIRFTNCYNNARCSPTRASLLTGQYPHTVGVGDLCRPTEETKYPGYMGYLNPNYPTLPELLKKVGYHTIMSGKWHLGGENVLEEKEDGFLKPVPSEYKKWPLKKGFDKFFGLIYGMSGTFKAWPSRPFVEGEKIYKTDSHPGGFYASNAFTDFSLKYIEEIRKQDDNPFLLYLSFTAPHFPIEAPETYIEKYRNTFNTPEKIEAIRKNRYDYLLKKGLVPESWSLNKKYATPEFINGKYKSDSTYLKKISEYLATYAAMMDIVDENIGRVIKKLKDLGELDNTIILYMSDNGPVRAGPGDLFNAPFYGMKGQLKEGSIKTPMVVYWPEKITKPGRISNQQVHVFDLLPTLLDVVSSKYPEKYNGTNLQPMEGASFLPTLISEKTTSKNKEFIFWDLYGQQAGIYQGRWKWYNNKKGRDFLYDLSIDGAETNSIVDAQPEIVSLLKKKFTLFAEKTHVMPLDSVKIEIEKNRIRLYGDKNKESNYSNNKIDKSNDN